MNLKLNRDWLPIEMSMNILVNFMKTYYVENWFNFSQIENYCKSEMNAFGNYFENNIFQRNIRLFVRKA